MKFGKTLSIIILSILFHLSALAESQDRNLTYQDVETTAANNGMLIIDPAKDNQVATRSNETKTSCGGCSSSIKGPPGNKPDKASPDEFSFPQNDLDGFPDKPNKNKFPELSRLTGQADYDMNEEAYRKVIQATNAAFGVLTNTFSNAEGMSPDTILRIQKVTAAGTQIGTKKQEAKTANKEARELDVGIEISTNSTNATSGG